MSDTVNVVCRATGRTDVLHVSVTVVPNDILTELGDPILTELGDDLITET